MPEVYARLRTVTHGYAHRGQSCVTAFGCCNAACHKQGGWSARCVRAGVLWGGGVTVGGQYLCEREPKLRTPKCIHFLLRRADISLQLPESQN